MPLCSFFSSHLFSTYIHISFVLIWPLFQCSKLEKVKVEETTSNVYDKEISDLEQGELNVDDYDVDIMMAPKKTMKITPGL